MAPKSTKAVAKTEEKSPSRLDQSQVNKASTALLKHIGDSKKSKDSKDLLEAGNEDSAIAAVPIWLVVNTKKHIVDQAKLKPGKISIPHSLNRPEATICLITADPQRAFKDVVADESFPAALRSQIRVLGIQKVKQRYKSFEQRRQLMAEYDTFLADDRIITNLPKLLGKIAYQSSKRPMPIDLKPSNEPKETKVPGKKSTKDISQRKTPSAATLAKRIEAALNSARVHFAPSASTAVHVGFSHFKSQQLDENINAVVDGLVEKYIPKGWKNIKSLFIKGPTTTALPIWQTSELWMEEDEVLEDEDAEAAKSINQKGKRKRTGEGEAPTKRKKLLGDEAGFTPEIAARREALRKAKKEAIEAPPVTEPVVKKTKTTEAKLASNGKVKTKTTRSRTVSTAA